MGGSKLERRRTAPVGNIHVGAVIDQSAQGLGVVPAAIAEVFSRDNSIHNRESGFRRLSMRWGCASRTLSPRCRNALLFTLLESDN
jgi:hypothetical protein